MKIVNGFLILVITLITGFFSVFSLGSYQQKVQLMNELPFSFIFRFLAVLAIGFTGVILLVLANFLIAKLILKQGNSRELKKLTVEAAIPVILVALFGVWVFFFF
ncbi:hypothetical protein SAMN05444397_107218 [Flavobacterium aquidurense]|uniref:Uncharacterized protein n=1 Tax=Flavobacterium frigidimaris TaxID=262320 RepID=A0ABX4BVV3_FLAFR|nr:hypothetical protein [Flavobacterium frigidimaris]OXA82470.1 hypothetical protein B0A65_00265 [Flavobacterium frigidimaris]SDZ48318.1 hypothetical protein SAMN05444397_107218 [Flavobacterium aquidurense]